MLYFLEHNKPGLPKKQIKRVQKIARLYEFTNNYLFYLHNNELKQIPYAKERAKICKDAHEMGHFQTESTLKRVQQTYFWPYMIKEVYKAVKSCKSCLKNHVQIPVHHPARALEIKGIFDRIGVDLTFGLTETKEGYCGLLVIVEYVTKFQWAIPIKSKCADEISDHLWQFFCQFGPAKEMLTDQGGEFNNMLVDNLCKRLKINHNTTCAYTPTTNGMVERFGFVFVEALRKTVDDDLENWPKYVPFVLLAFRTQYFSHSRTTENSTKLCT